VIQNQDVKLFTLKKLSWFLKQAFVRLKQKFYYLPAYMFIKEAAFSEGRLLSCQSEQFKKLSKNSDWLEKIQPSKKCHCVFGNANRLYLTQLVALCIG